LTRQKGQVPEGRQGQGPDPEPDPGLPVPEPPAQDGQAREAAAAGGQTGLVPLYAGPAPALTGVQQVNVAVPSGLAPGAAPLIVCATVAEYLR